MDIKVIEGKGGQLYLGGADSNNVVGQISGQISISTFSLNCLINNYFFRKKLGKKYGHTSVFLTCPEAHVVRRDSLPDNVVLSRFRPVRMFCDYISGDDIVYPEAEIRNVELSGISCYDFNDSHWNKRGAYHAFLSVMDSAKQLFRVSGLRERLTFYPVVRVGDLGNKFEPQRDATSFNVSITNSGAKNTFHNGVQNHGNVQVFENLSAPKGKCVVFGTSFSDYYLEFIAECFQEVVFCYSTNVDESIISMCSPDLVLYETPERFLLNPVSDYAFSPVTVSFLKKSILYADYVAEIFNDGASSLGKYFLDLKKAMFQKNFKSSLLNSDVIELLGVLQFNPLLADSLLASTFDAKLAGVLYNAIDKGKVRVAFLEKYNNPIASIARLRTKVKDNPKGDYSNEISSYVGAFGMNDDIDFLLGYLKKNK